MKFAKIITGQSGFSVVEVLLTAIMMSFLSSGALALILLMQKASANMELAATREVLRTKIQSTVLSPRGLQQTIARDSNFETCFKVRSPGVSFTCTSGDRVDFTLYDFDGQPIGGPKDQAPIVYDHNGARCAGLTAPTPRCPISVTVSYQAQGFPKFDCSTCSSFVPLALPPLGYRHEFLEVHYSIQFASTLQKPVDGTITIDLSDWGT